MARFTKVLLTLLKILDDENAALRSGRQNLIAELNQRKAQAYVECSQVMASLKPANKLSHDVMSHLQKLRERLSENQALLKVHLDALSEITLTLADAMKEQEWDGTYSPTSHRK